MPIGLKRGTVSVEPHNQAWDVSARDVISTLKGLLQGDIVDAQHIGSTAIESICAKPIIDIVVGVADFQHIMRHNDLLAQHGIFYRKEDHPGQHLYVCADGENVMQSHYIHVVLWGSDHWHNYINIRDYLNFNEAIAAEYSALKEQLATQYPDNRAAYTRGKHQLIAQILKDAQTWRQQEAPSMDATTP